MHSREAAAKVGPHIHYRLVPPHPHAMVNRKALMHTQNTQEAPQQNNSYPSQAILSNNCKA